MNTLCKLTITTAILALVVISTCQTASAYWPHRACYPFFGGNSYYTTYSQESVPYYALNPPVYYSYHIARTYGLYPFPYIPETTNDSGVRFEPIDESRVEPKLVINQLVEQQSPSTSATLARKPLRISNPFVTQEPESKTAGDAESDNQNPVKPKIVYPSKLASR
jgi:hypothetical protein